MDAIDKAEGYLIQAALEAEHIYTDDDNPEQDVAELESVIHEAMRQIAQIKHNRAD